MRLGHRPVPLERVSLSFPPDLSQQQVAAVLGAIAGLPRRARVSFEVSGEAGELQFWLAGSQRDVSLIASALHGIAPGVLLEPAAPDIRPQGRVRAHVGWRGSYVLLRTDETELAVASLLAVLRTTGRKEALRLTIQLRPLVRPKAPSHQAARREGDWLTRLLTPAPAIPSDQLHAVRQQYAGPLLGVRLRIDAHTASVARGRQLITGVVAILRSRSSSRGRFFVRTHRFAWPSVGVMLAPTELTALLGWPLGGPGVPSLRFNRAPRLLPDSRIPASGPGRTFGTSTWPSLRERKIVQPPAGTLSHSLVLGPTGSGKSALLSHLVLDDIQSGRGALILDMKGDTATDLLHRLPNERQTDVVVLDPSDNRPPPGVKAIDAAAPELAADLWSGIFRNLFSDNWGLRSERYLRLGVQTLAQRPGQSIEDLPRLFSDMSFRRNLLSASTDAYLRTSWADLDALSPKQLADYLAPMLSKVHDVINRRVVRGVLGQRDPKLRLGDAMQQGKIVVIRLCPGELGQGAAQLLGSVVVFEAYQAVLQRQTIPEAQRQTFGFYIDEPAVLGALPLPLDSLFELARGLGVGLTIAAQSLTQLPTEVRRAALTNAATIATFAASADDAQLLARELLGVTADQLQHLERFEIAVRLGLDHGLRAPVTTVRTLAPSPTVRRTTAALRNQSATRYGGPPAEGDSSAQSTQPGATEPVGHSAANDVDETENDIEPAPIGRVRRSS